MTQAEIQQAQQTYAAHVADLRATELKILLILGVGAAIAAIVIGRLVYHRRQIIIARADHAIITAAATAVSAARQAKARWTTFKSRVDARVSEGKGPPPPTDVSRET
jgi:hypothetical protein